MTIHVFLDEALTSRISEGDFTNPDKDTFNGTDGETKDRRLFLANEQVVLATAINSEQTTMELSSPGFQNAGIIILGGEQMRVLSGGGTFTLGVERGYGGTPPMSHDAGSIVFSGYDYTEITVDPIDTADTDERPWVRLALNAEELDTAMPGASLELGSKTHDQTLTFWRRVSVPPATPVQNKTDLKIRVTALENPIL